MDRERVDGVRLESDGDASRFEDEVGRIVGELRDLDGPDVVSIGEIPSAALAHWPNRTTDHVVITRRQRAHYLDEHPEMAEFEKELDRTPVDPEQVHVESGSGDTAALFGPEDTTHDIVPVSSDASLANSVITARQQRATRKRRPANRLRMVWEK